MAPLFRPDGSLPGASSDAACTSLTAFVQRLCAIPTITSHNVVKEVSMG
jgi:hypothetical protein